MSAQDARGRRSHINMGPERSTPSQPNINTHRHNKPPANVSTQDSVLNSKSKHSNDDPLGKRSEASRRVLARASEYTTSEAD
jgi:hypothetical protein